jgi:hypothetical protein
MVCSSLRKRSAWACDRHARGFVGESCGQQAPFKRSNAEPYLEPPLVALPMAGQTIRSGCARPAQHAIAKFIMGKMAAQKMTSFKGSWHAWRLTESNAFLESTFKA